MNAILEAAQARSKDSIGAIPVLSHIDSYVNAIATSDLCDNTTSAKVMASEFMILSVMALTALAMTSRDTLVAGQRAAV